MPFRTRSLKDLGAMPQKNAAPKFKKNRYGGAEPPPHIGRRSRYGRGFQNGQESDALVMSAKPRQEVPKTSVAAKPLIRALDKKYLHR